MTNKQTLKGLAAQVESLKQEVEALSVKQASGAPDDQFELMELLEKTFRGIEVDLGSYGGQINIALSKKLSPAEVEQLTMLEEQGDDYFYELHTEHQYDVWHPVSAFLDKLYGHKWDLKNIEGTIEGNVFTVYTTVYTPAM